MSDMGLDDLSGGIGLMRKRKPVEDAREDLTFRLRRGAQKMMSRSSKLVGQRFDPGDFEIVKVRIDIPRLSTLFQGYRIVHISDIHYGQWISADRLKGVVGLINQQEPDIVAITGDFVSYSWRNIEGLIPALKGIRARDGTVAVLGNHDHWLGAKKIRSILSESKIIELNNDVYTVTREGCALHFAGVDSTTVKKNQLNKVLQRLPSGGPAILLAHEPDFADISAETKRFSVQLSGHSHGGQFVIPKLGTPFRGDGFKKYPLRKYQVGEMTLYTNPGIGTNTFWIRINCAPEITVIDLQSKEKGA
jgi:predicted MPP superfamily phosphohydrolase